jgi:type III secretion protein J
MRLLGAAVALLLSACTVELQHDLSEDDANDIYVLLQGRGIDVQKLKEEGGNEPRYIISVGKQRVADAARALRENSLPRPKADGLGVFKKMKGMIPTQTEERAMFIEALAGEITNTFNRIPGVLEARCIVMLPEVNDLTQPEKKPMPSASVFIIYKLNERDPKWLPIEADEVREFVSRAVPELRKQDVTVLFKPSVKNTDPNDVKNVAVLGISMEEASANQFKVMIAVGAMVILAMAALTVFAFVRRPANVPAPRRTKTNAEG